MSVKGRREGLALALRVQGRIPETVHRRAADPPGVTNLIGNAIKFTEHGSVTVTLSLDASNDPALLRFDVRDTGIGIAPDKAALIFEPFVQADSSVHRRFGGTGLGLTISRKVRSGAGRRHRRQRHPWRGSTFSATVSTGALEGVRMLDETASRAVSKSRPAPKRHVG